MSDAHRTCCGCQSAMRKVFTRGVELDWCQFCGGVYFDRGELERVLGHPIQLEPGPERPRRCPDCSGHLREERLAHHRVDACPPCGGFYLDPEELDALAGEHVKLLPLPEPAKEAITFRCKGCGELVRLEDGYTMAEGMVCRICAPGFSGHGFPGPAAMDGPTQRAIAGMGGIRIPLPGPSLDGPAGVVANVAAAAIAPNPFTLLGAVASLFDLLDD